MICVKHIAPVIWMADSSQVVQLVKVVHSSEVRAKSETLDWPDETLKRSISVGFVYVRTERRTQAAGDRDTHLAGKPPSHLDLAGQIAERDL